MQILKIKDREAGITVSYQHDGADCTVRCDETPAQSFTDALDDLLPLVQNICGFPKGYDADMVVTGLSLSPAKDGNLRLCIQAKKDLKAGSPLNINTPNRFLYPTGEGDDTGACLSDKQAVKVTRMCEQAILYVKGMRAQRQIYLNLKDAAGDQIVDGIFTESEVSTAAR